MVLSALTETFSTFKIFYGLLCTTCKLFGGMLERPLVSFIRFILSYRFFFFLYFQFFCLRFSLNNNILRCSRSNFKNMEKVSNILYFAINATYVLHKSIRKKLFRVDWTLFSDLPSLFAIFYPIYIFETRIHTYASRTSGICATLFYLASHLTTRWISECSTSLSGELLEVLRVTRKFAIRAIAFGSFR